MSSRIRSIAFFVLFSAISGCGYLVPGLTYRDTLAFVPSGADAVRVNSERFKTADNDPLRALPDGAVRDPLTGLDGCWGGFEQYDLVFGAKLANADYYRFDLANSKCVYERLQSSGLGLAASIREEFDIVRVGTERITLKTTRSRFASTILPAEIGGDGVMEFTPTDEPAWDISVTREGDRFVLRESEGYTIVFIRMDCP